MLIKLAKDFDSTVPYQQYTDESVLKYNYKKEHVKVEAKTYVDGQSLMMHGYIPVDVRTIFRRLYPTAEQSSLKWFLAKNKLGGKEDMPYETLFKIYSEYRNFTSSRNLRVRNDEIDVDLSKLSDIDKAIYADLKAKLASINYYCVIDAQRCHDLMKIRSVVMDHREVSNLAYTSLYDAFYRANGMKVRNLTIAVGQREPFNIRFTNITNNETEEGKYPGAYVFPPKKGLKTSKLSIDERIAKAKLLKKRAEDNPYEGWLSVTPKDLETLKAAIQTNGATWTPEQIVQYESNNLDGNGKPKPFPKIFKDFLKEPIGRPIAGLDFSSLYPSLIRTYNLSPEYCILDKKQAQAISATGQKLIKIDFEFNGRRRLAYFIWHNNKYDPKDPEFKFGVYPFILDDLFKKRAALKKQQKAFDSRKEQIEAMSKEEQEKLADEYAEVVFNRNYFNSKQNALKVFMNTFYGECGNKLSPFFVLEVAGGITSMGQRNIKFAQAFVTEKGCIAYYGDSVAKYTPILVRRGVDGEIKYMEIQQLAEQYYPCHGDKEISLMSNIEIWSDLGWTPIKYVIRHKTSKRMFRIITSSGIVDVTEDHSLLDIDGIILKPTNAVGKELLTKNLPNLSDDIGQDFAHHCLYLENSGYGKSQISMALDYAVTCISNRSNANIEYEEKDQSCKFHSTYLVPNNTVIKMIELPPTDDYVYDIETGNHHFSAGIGNLVVHNTDSVYISMPEVTFRDIDIQYYTGQISKIDYWTKMVELSFVTINVIRDGVNEEFFKDNRTKFLSMAYEEFLFPVVFTAKKKYFGIAHEHIANFKPKELFIRGLEVKKRGVSDLLKKVCMEIMWATMTPDNLFDLVELTLHKIDEIYSRKWEAKDFIQTGVFRPGKENVKINTFVKRMAERGIDIKPNERFDYVIVKRYPFKYDLRGRKTSISIGDKIELADAKGVEVDLDYYMQGGVNGQLARLITYHEMFQVEPLDNSAAELQIAEVATYKNACKFIESYCDKYYAKYNTLGKAFQKIYKTVSKYVGGAVHRTDELASALLTANVDYNDFEAWFVDYTAKAADNLVGDYGKQHISAELDKVSNMVRESYASMPESERPSTADINKEVKERREEKITLLQKAYYSDKRKSIEAQRKDSYKVTMGILRTKVRDNFEKIMKVYKTYNSSIEDLISLIKQKLNITDDMFAPASDSTDYKLEDFGVPIDSDFESELTEKANIHIDKMFEDDTLTKNLEMFESLYDYMVAAHLYIKRTESVVSYLKLRRNTVTGFRARPSDETIQQTIKESLERDKEELMRLRM
jgi:DNA polymerase elongation subunit (family B)